MRSHFLPALLGLATIPDGLRERLKQPVRNGGLGIPNPCERSDALFEASEKMTESLTASLLDNKSAFSVGDYIMRSREARDKCRTKRHKLTDMELQQYLSTSTPEEARFTRRSGETGVCLTTIHHTFNGNVLSKEEFRDSLRLRFGLGIDGLPSKCDGCGADFDITHALNCKKGGLVLRKYEDVNDTFLHLCSQAYQPSSVSRKPFIKSNVDNKKKVGKGREQTVEEQAETLEDMGDTAVSSFWTKGTQAIFDVRVTNLDSGSQIKSDPGSCLRKNEKEKMLKYNKACLASRNSFTPLVFFVME